MNTKLIIGVIVIFIIIIAMIYFMNRKPYTHNIILDAPLFLVDEVYSAVSVDKLPESKMGRKYTYTMWLNIPNVPENSVWQDDFQYKKPIVFHYGSPNVYYLPKKHHILVSIAYKNELNEKDYYEFIIDDFKSQKWVNLGVVVDNRNIDIYLDGELYASTFLPNVPWIPNKFLYLGQKNNNFNGHIYYLEYANTNLNSSQIKNIYHSGLKHLPQKLMTYSDYFNKTKTKKF